MKITPLQLLTIILSVILLSAGQILFKMAASEMNFTARKILISLINPKFLIALLVYAVATLFWLMSLKEVPLRVAYPFAALAFFIVPTLSHLILGETVTWRTYLGALMISIGVFISISE